MSRRKQGRPQQRKTLDPVEQENDLLICGNCNANFQLQDILKFIRHKINRCDKENVDLENLDLDEEDQADPEAISLGTNFKTSITSLISKKELLGNKLTPQRSLEYLKDAILQVSKVQEDDEKLFDLKYQRSPLKTKTANAETNTSSSEPLRMVCECCNTVFSSAWSLLQHAQKDHKIRLYREEMDLSPTPPKQQKLLESPLKESLQNRPSPILNPNSPHHHRRPQSRRSNGDLQDRHDYQEGKEQSLSQSFSSQEQHRTPSAASSVGSTESGHVPLPHRQSPQNIFMNAFRFPFPDRHSLSPSMPFPRLPGTEFPPMTTETALLTQRGLLGFPPNIFEHGRPFPSISGMFERPRPAPQSGNLLESQDSIYSNRLKELARRPPSPVARRQTPPFSQSSGQVVSSPLFSPLPHAQSEPPQKEQTSGIASANKLKSCEFCGKSFRFQSNLIVHRRSHTGEKPFKCSLCPHACTQQSKLKRHMKTHLNKSTNSNNCADGQLGSGNSTPDSRSMYMDRDDDNDDDDEEEEEEEEGEEEEMERGEEEEEESQTGIMNKRKELDEMSEQSNSLPASKLERTSPDNNLEGNVQGLFNKSSVLREVMKNTGLNHLSPYSDAFKQAMDETIKTEKNDSKTPSENGSSISNGINEDSKDASQALSRPPSDSENDTKSVKREPESPMLNNFLGMENVFSPLWHHPPPELFPLMPSPFARFDRDPNHNNFNATAESALKSLTPGLQKTGRPGTEEMNGIGSNGRRGDNKRNDTCEFCGKVFKNCSNLTVHRRSHTGEKPYKCELCSYACAQSSKLTRHMKTHGRVGKDVYRCKFCAMPFSVASTLEKHMRKCVEKCQGRVLPDTDSDTNEGSERGSVVSHISSPLMPSSSHAALLGGSPVPSSSIAASVSPLLASSAGNPALAMSNSSLLGGSVLPPSSIVSSAVPSSSIAASMSPLLASSAGNPALVMSNSPLLGGSTLPPSTLVSSHSQLLSSTASPGLPLANNAATTNA